MQYYTSVTKLPSYIPYAKFLLLYPLSETARVVYSLILSRISLAQSNGWVDEEDRVYCRYTIRSLMEDTGKSKSTIVTALSDLESNGLITRQRGGAGYANRLYLRLPVIRPSEDRKTAPQWSEKPASNKYNNKNNKPINYEYKGDSL